MSHKLYYFKYVSITSLEIGFFSLFLPVIEADIATITMIIWNQINVILENSSGSTEPGQPICINSSDRYWSNYVSLILTFGSSF